MAKQTAGPAALNPFGQELDLRRVLYLLYAGKWYMLAGMVLCFIPAMVYLQMTPELYRAQGRMKSEIASGASMDLIPSGGLVSGPSMQAEVELMRSGEILSELVERANLMVSYSQQGRINRQQFHPSQVPFVVLYDTGSFRHLDQPFRLEFVSESSFQLRAEATPEVVAEGRLGERVRYGKSWLTLTRKTGRTDPLTNTTYYFTVHDRDRIINTVRGGLNITPDGGSRIFTITYVDQVPYRAAIIINTLMDLYLEDELELKKRSTKQTMAFIDTLIRQVQRNLVESQTELETFEMASRLNLPDVATASQEEAGGLVEELKQQRLTMLALNELERILAQLSQRREDTQIYFIPDLKGLADNSQLQNVVGNLNDLLLKRSITTNRFNQESPVVRSLDERIAQMLSMLDHMVAAYRAQLTDRNAYLRQRIRQIERLSLRNRNLERDEMEVRRPYELYADMYNSLFIRKTEASIALASITSNSRVLDQAYAPAVPISPNKPLYQYGSLAIGFLLGLGFVFLRQALKDTVSQRMEIESRTRLPVLAEIFRMKQETTKDRNVSLQVFRDTKSIFTESFRVLRSNLQFVLKTGKTQTVTVTSTISGEGKSYIALNLSAMFAAMKKRTLLIDLDLRRPRMHLIMNAPNYQGASTYLIGRHSLEDVAIQTSYEYFDLITAGPLPPNPAELLSSEKLTELLEEAASKYDYVVVDTSPVGLVTDAIPIIKASAANLFIFRANYSKRDFLKFAERFADEQQLQNLSIVFNYASPELSKYGYGYGYGYGYAYAYGESYYTRTESTRNWRRWLRKRFKL